MLNTAASLRHPLIERHVFDPTDPTHLESMDTFLRTGNWGAVQFFPELPFVEVPITVLTKFAMHQRKLSVESSSERRDRLAAKNLVHGQVVESKADRKKRLELASQVTLAAIAAERAAAKAPQSEEEKT